MLEHHSLGIVETPDGPRTRVVVVAARRDMIDRLLDATRKAGLRPVGVDLSAFAMIRALYRPELTGATLYTSVGGLTNLAVAIDQTCAFTRVAGTDIICVPISATFVSGIRSTALYSAIPKSVAF